MTVSAASHARQSSRRIYGTSVLSMGSFSYEGALRTVCPTVVKLVDQKRAQGRAHSYSRGFSLYRSGMMVDDKGALLPKWREAAENGEFRRPLPSRGPNSATALSPRSVRAFAMSSKSWSPARNCFHDVAEIDDHRLVVFIERVPQHRRQGGGADGAELQRPVCQALRDLPELGVFQRTARQLLAYTPGCGSWTPTRSCPGRRPWRDIHPREVSRWPRMPSIRSIG